MMPEPLHSLPPLPPCNIELESALLGAILVDNKTYSEVCNVLKPVHFFDETHRRIYEAISSVVHRGAQATPATLRHFFERGGSLAEVGGAQYLTELAASVFSTISVSEFAATLIDLSQRRRLIVACYEQAENLANPTIEVTAEEIGSSLITETERVLMESGQRVQGRRAVSEAIVEDLSRPLTCHSTGLDALDKSMGGGLFPGRAYGFAARKKTGKTQLMGSISYNLNEAEIPHLFICAEMSPFEIEQRNIARGLRFNSMQFLNPDYRNAPEFQKSVANYAATLKDNIIYEHVPGISLDNLRRLVYGAATRHGIRGFIVDYLQLVSGKQKGQSYAEHLDTVSQWIADACRRLNIWAMVPAQINQDSERQNIRGGEGMRLSFDQVYALHRDEASNCAWLTMWETRYTVWRDVGSESNPALRLSPDFPDR